MFLVGGDRPSYCPCPSLPFSIFIFVLFSFIVGLFETLLDLGHGLLVVQGLIYFVADIFIYCVDDIE